jgi:hypothetical protein
VSWVALLFLAGLAVVVTVAVVAFNLEQKRRERVLAFALGRGWLYEADDPSLVDAFPGEPFGRGDSRRARTVLRGKESGRDFVAFDYSYATHTQTSKERRTTVHRYAVVAVPLPVPLGVVEVRPEGLMARAADAIGVSGDLELESEDFNRRFRVRARNAKLASDVLSPRTMEYLVAQRRDAVPAFRVSGGHVVAWRTGRLEPMEVVRTCAVLDRVLDGVPSFVWRDAGLPGGYDPGP